MRVRLTPKSAMNQVAGIGKQADGKPHIKAMVRALPEKGRANMALEALIAGVLGVAKRDVRVASGPRSRYKSVMITGDPADLIDRTSGLLEDPGNK